MSKVFDPIKIGRMEVKNRFVRAPCLMSYCTAGGYVTNRELEYHRAVAEGGTGLVVVGVHFLHPRGRVWGGRAGMGASSNRSMIFDDSYIPGLRKLAETIHQGGAKCSLQICHTGKFSDAEVVSVASEVNPSLLRPDQVMKEMTHEEIAEEIENYAQATRRIKESGFDAVDIHAAHGFLPQQFMSPYTNVRKDKYGKDRVLFSVELVQRMRAVVGPDFPIIFRISGDEYLGEVGKEGYTVDDMKDIAPRLEEAGVDCLHISAGTPEVAWMPMQPSSYPKGCLLYLAEAVKKLVKIPVIGVGRINDPETVTSAIENGQCDLVALGRGLIADPAFPRKMEEGRPEDIRKCIACLYCLEHSGSGVECALNYEIGRMEEAEIIKVSSEKIKNVAIVGGGPGGMEAARVAKLRGHNVTLYEKRDILGGQLLEASKGPGKDEIGNVTEYLSAQIKKLDVKLVMGKEFTAETAKEENFDVIVVATGSTPAKPDIQGINGNNVVMAKDVLLGKVEAGENVAVIGGEVVGCEVAEFLLEKGKKVTIMDIPKVDPFPLPGFPSMATNVNPLTRIPLLKRLLKGGVEMLNEVEYKEITEDGVKLTDSEGNERFIEADTVVICAGSRPNRELIEKLRGATREMIYEIGDCIEPRQIRNAIHEGAIVARML